LLAIFFGVPHAPPTKPARVSSSNQLFSTNQIMVALTAIKIAPSKTLVVSLALASDTPWYSKTPPKIRQTADRKTHN
jgi:hypothetical protein